MTIKAIFFDLGSTLIYFDGDWAAMIAQANTELQRFLQAAGVSLDWPTFFADFGARTNAYYAERNTEFIEYTTHYILKTTLADYGWPDLPETVLRPALRALYSASQARWQPEQDALPLLAELQQAGYCLGIISNAADDDDVQLLVDKGDFRPYLDFVISSARMGIRKPNPRIFRAALDQCGVSPLEAVMVGDMLGADILGAHNAGMKGIWITRRADVAANRDHLDTIQPDAMIKTLGELPAVVAAF